MKYNIFGSVMQAVNIELSEGESVISEAGALSWMTDNIKMESKMVGGIGGMIGRAFSGESLFLTKFTSTGGTGIVSFSLTFPGKIIPMEIKDGREIICQKDSFLVSEETVSLKTHFRKKIGTGIFGGEGFILQKISGDGTAFIEVDGEVIEMDLKEGEAIKVSTGSIAAFESTVSYEVETIRGITNKLFGGEGVFISVLKGPGKVWLQTLPRSKMISKLLYGRR